MGIGITLEIYHQANGLPGACARFVLDVGDSLDALIFDQLADHLVQPIAGLLIRNFLDNDAIAAAFLFNIGAGPQGNLAASGAVAVVNALMAADDAAGWKIGAADQLDQLVDADFGIVNDADEAVANLAQIVRRNFGGHADGDPVRAVDEQIGKFARQHERFAIFAVVIVHEIDGVAFQILEHLGSHGGQAGLGIAHGRGGQAGDGAEVALARE